MSSHRIYGRLLRNAHSARDAAGTAMLVLDLTQQQPATPDDAQPHHADQPLVRVIAAQLFGAGASRAIAASHAARQLRAGDTVCVWCTGIVPADPIGTDPCIRLVGVHFIERLGITRSRKRLLTT